MGVLFPFRWTRVTRALETRLQAVGKTTYRLNCACWLTDMACFTCAHFHFFKKQTSGFCDGIKGITGLPTSERRLQIRVRLSLCREWGWELGGWRYVHASSLFNERSEMSMPWKTACSRMPHTQRLFSGIFRSCDIDIDIVGHEVQILINRAYSKFQN